MNSMLWENQEAFQKNKREALIKKMVLKRLGDEIRPISFQTFVFQSFSFVAASALNAPGPKRGNRPKQNFPRWRKRFRACLKPFRA